MDFKTILLSLVLISTFSQTCFSQHIKIDKKALSFLVTEEKVNVVFTYDSLTVDENNETVFLEKMYTKVGNKETVANAETWTSNYHQHKKTIWPETFLNTLNEKLNEYESSPTFVQNENTEYTMRVQTDWMYFGYDASIVAKPARVSLTLTFTETKNPEIVLFKTEINKAQGNYNIQENDIVGVGPNLNRMNKAYLTAGYGLAKAFKRIVD